MKFKETIAVILAAFILISSSIGYSASVQDLQNKKNQVKNQMNNLKNQIGQIQNQKDDLGNQIASINQKIDSVQNSLNNVNEQLNANQDKLKSVSAEIDEATKKQAEQENTLKKRLVVYYENGNTSYLDVLLNSQNFTDLLERYELIKQLVDYDNTIISDIQATEKELNDKKAELEATKAEIVKEKDNYQKIQAQFEASKSEREKILNKLTDDQKKVERQLEIEEAASNEIAREIQKFQNEGSKSPYTGGKLGWPTPGYYTITSPFGWRIHPVLGYKKFHSGVDIGAPMGATVVAANDGVVRIAGWVSGYGNTVMIDHGGGIATLYGHNSALLVSEGQQVKRGQAISKVGMTGIATGPHLHFEVRQNGNPVDPMQWVK